MPKFADAQLRLKSMKCDVRKDFTLDKIVGMSFDITLDPNIIIDGKISTP